jgi:hypothetical protein
MKYSAYSPVISVQRWGAIDKKTFFRPLEIYNLMKMTAEYSAKLMDWILDCSFNCKLGPCTFHQRFLRSIQVTRRNIEKIKRSQKWFWLVFWYFVVFGVYSVIKRPPNILKNLIWNVGQHYFMWKSRRKSSFIDLVPPGISKSKTLGFWENARFNPPQNRKMAS